MCIFAAVFRIKNRCKLFLYDICQKSFNYYFHAGTVWSDCQGSNNSREGTV